METRLKNKSNSGAASIISGLRKLFLGKVFMWIQALAAAGVLIYAGTSASDVLSYDIIAYGGIGFVILASLMLIICDDLTAVVMPLMLISIMVLPCYDSFNTFIKFIWLVPIPISALLFHFIAYRRRLELGTSFFGLLAVAVAVTLGGIGSITADEYFTPMSMYYTIMLGVGMCAAYMLIKPQVYERREYNISDKFIDVMFIAGLFAGFVAIFLMYRECLSSDVNPLELIRGLIQNNADAEALERAKAIEVQAQNNLSTIMMICMPFAFYKTIKRSAWYLVSIPFIMLGIYILKSRGGCLFGTLELIICVTAFSFIIKRKPLRIICRIAAAIMLAVFAVGIYYELTHDFVSSDEARAKLITRSFEDLLENLPFGKGIGNQANRDIYDGRTGSLIWYHMMWPQIWGSMGLVGVLAYIYQLFNRTRLTLKKLNPYSLTFAMSYVGLFLMSQVNPGEFCPIPYTLLGVIMFIMIENQPDKKESDKSSKKQAKKAIKAKK